MTIKLPDDVLTAVGIPASSVIEDGGRDLIADGPARGFDRADAPLPPPPYVSIALDALTRMGGSVSVARPPVNPSVLCFDDEHGRLARVIGAELSPPATRIYIRGDAKVDRDAWLWRPGDAESESVLFHVVDGNVQVLLVRSPMAAGWQRASSVAAATPLVVSVPALAALTENAPVEPWLVAEFTRLADSDWAPAKVAAVGLVARLWALPLGAPARQDRPAAKAPRQYAERWFAQLPDDTRQRIVAGAARRAELLASELEPLHAAVLADPQAATAALTDWLHVRDDLESIARLVKATDSPGSEWLATAIASLDRDAAEFHSMYLFVASLAADERLLAVSWQEPESFWGRLAGMSAIGDFADGDWNEGR